jgi:DNA-binding XRE family transcriptional regulator
MTNDSDTKAGGPASSPPLSGVDRRTRDQLDKLPPDARARAEAAIARARTPEYRAEQGRFREKYRSLRRDPMTSGDYQVWGRHGDLLDFLGFLGRLRGERERQGLSLDDMAARTGMDRMAISRLENGKNLNPTISTLVRYVNALGHSIIWGSSAEGARPDDMTIGVAEEQIGRVR